MKFTQLLTILILFYFTACNDLYSDKFRTDNNNSGISKSDIVENPTKSWEYKTNGNINASIVTDGQKVYIGSGDSTFYALNAISGKLEWKFRTNGKINSTAVINGKYIYFLSEDGFLYKLNKKNGKEIWKFKTEGEKKHIIKDYYNPKNYVIDFWDFYQSSPSVYNDKIYFGCGEFIYAVNVVNGEEVWNYKTEGAVHSSPAIKDNNLVIGSFDSRIYCLDTETGNKNWIYETGRDTAQYIWLGVQASPSISCDSVFIGSRDALIYCLDLFSGDTIWTNNNFERSWMPSSFAITDRLYSGSSDGFSFYAINKSSGKIDYKLKTNSYTFSSPVVTNRMAYIGSANGRLYGINLDQEKISWEFQTNGSLSDTLGIYNSNGEMDRERLKFLFKQLEIDNYEKLYKFYTIYFKSVGAIVSSPVINNGILYFGSADGYVYALENK